MEARLQIASHAVGAATRSAEIANEHATTRHQLGRPIRDFQAVEVMLADMAGPNRRFTAWPGRSTAASTAAASTPMPAP